MKMVLKVALVAVFATTPAFADLLWDNGDTDGSNGYSNADRGAFGALRTLLDDFVVPDGGWVLQDFHSYQIWNSMPPGSGTDYSLSIRADAGGSPGAVIATAVTQSYSEAATGRVWFGRQEYETTYTFDDIPLGPGVYWIEGNVIGPENNFWMIRQQVTGSECWINYEDFGGMMPGSALFGGPADLSFKLTGIPEPASLFLLGLGALALRRR
jgi:hypothetical protein